MNMRRFLGRVIHLWKDYWTVLLFCMFIDHHRHYRVVVGSISTNTISAYHHYNTVKHVLSDLQQNIEIGSRRTSGC